MGVSVAHVMSHKVILVAPDRTIDHARELMGSKRIHALPVADMNRKLLGIVTSADVSRKIDGSREVREIMSSKVHVISATEPVSEAAKIMRKYRIHHLVVTDGKTAVGIISAYDLLKLVEQGSV